MTASDPAVAAARPALTPIVQDSTPALIADQLREAVASGVFAPGQQMVESALARELGVSRGPLREAMQRLTQEGLLVGHRNRGLFVMDLDHDAVRDMYLAREAVERAAAAHLIKTGRAEQASSLLDIVEQMRANTGQTQQMSALDMAFHEQLVALANSPRLTLMHGTLLTQMRLCLGRMQSTYLFSDERVREHDVLARAIAAADSGLADRLLVEHMADGVARVLMTLPERA
ncbi:GntR family transcriptional regulator [Gephyromycinifex aptenodytis]|uniref:GntR family transcriptional regulator n=1 Tax=Gephyromycinifex aptenodytis TaxID=2716227 RepID=UPI00144664CB|nr:GntR family transcriptional regulator [Gephyromycinifex aptenodytis]